MSAAPTKNIEELVKPERPVSTLDRLRAGRSAELKTMTYEQLAELLTEEQALISVEEAGDGFYKDPNNKEAKRRLVGVPFIIVDSRDTPGKFGIMWTLRLVTQDNRRLIIIDGSTGIAAQMDSVKRSGYKGAIWCKHGLTVSEYPVVDRDHEGKADTCTACLGYRMIDPNYPEPVPGKKICDRCLGQGFELLRDQNGNVVMGETFYFDLTAAVA